MSGFHEPTVSGAHDSTISDAHAPILSGVHNPILSGGHDPVLSEAHNPVVSDLTTDDGTSPVVDFDDFFGSLEGVSIEMEGAQASQFRTSWVTPWTMIPARLVGLRTAQAAVCDSAQTLTASFSVSDLPDEVAISLGYIDGAQLAALGSCVRVILPGDFAFTDGWDAPPSGALFDLSGGVEGLFLAEVGAALPAGLDGWDMDFFLPDGARVELQTGFNALSYTGASGVDISAYVSDLGDGVLSVFRFNAVKQQYESYTVGAPAFVNSLTTLEQGDALIVRVEGGRTLSLIDLVPATPERVVQLQAGSNLVSYSGAGGEMASILAGVPGLVAAFVLDAESQQWLAYRPTGPAFLSQVTTLTRSQPVFLILNQAATWTYVGTNAAGGIPAALVSP